MVRYRNVTDKQTKNKGTDKITIAVVRKNETPLTVAQLDFLQ